MVKINADPDLKGQMAGSVRGPIQGNMSPSPAGMGPRSFGVGGNAGTGANPSRVGAAPKAMGSYKPISGSPAPGAAAVKPGAVPRKALGGASKVSPTLESVRQHGLALGGLGHALKIAGQPGHPLGKHLPALKAVHAHMSGHVDSYRAKAPQAPGGSFGSLGSPGSPNSGTGGGFPGGSGGTSIPGV